MTPKDQSHVASGAIARRRRSRTSAAVAIVAVATAGAFGYRALVDRHRAADAAWWDGLDPSRPSNERDEPSIRVPPWAEALSLRPDPRVVGDAAARARIEATGLAWQVRERESGVVLLLVPPGEYVRGAPSSDPDADGNERPQHRVRVTEPFYLGRSEVTVAEWKRFVERTTHRTDAEARGSSWTIGEDGEWLATRDANWRSPFPRVRFARPGDAWPVVHVSWNDANAFCSHFGSRLPREAEWEYACRAGTDTIRWWGDDPSGADGKGNFADRAAKKRFRGWTTFDFDDGHAVLAPVGRYAPNPWGFHDMLGNAWEWCSTPFDDAYGRFADRAPVDALAGEDGPPGYRVLRGAAWTAAPAYVRASFRGFDLATYSDDNLGFRIARDP